MPKVSPIAFDVSKQLVIGLFKRKKNNNKPVIRQILDLITGHFLRKSKDNFNSDKGYTRCHYI